MENFQTWFGHFNEYVIGSWTDQHIIAEEEQQDKLLQLRYGFAVRKKDLNVWEVYSKRDQIIL